MDGIKHSGRFAEMERLVNDYFKLPYRTRHVKNAN